MSETIEARVAMAAKQMVYEEASDRLMEQAILALTGAIKECYDKDTGKAREYMAVAEEAMKKTDELWDMLERFETKEELDRWIERTSESRRILEQLE